MTRLTDNLRFVASKKDGDPNISRVSSFLLIEAADEIERLRGLVRCLVENDPNDYAADAVTVLDVWRGER